MGGSRGGYKQGGGGAQCSGIRGGTQGHHERAPAYRDIAAPRPMPPVRGRPVPDPHTLSPRVKSRNPAPPPSPNETAHVERRSPRPLPKLCTRTCAGG